MIDLVALGTRCCNLDSTIVSRLPGGSTKHLAADFSGILTAELGTTACSSCCWRFYAHSVRLVAALKEVHRS
jgi:hypothetical protein